MSLPTSLSNFKPTVLTVEKQCAGCGRKHLPGTTVQSKFGHTPERTENFRRAEITVLCPDSTDQCWQAYDEKFWNDRIESRKENPTDSRRHYAEGLRPVFFI